MTDSNPPNQIAEVCREQVDTRLTMRELIIWGTGGHAKVVFDAARALGYSRIQFVADNVSAPLFLGCPVTEPAAFSESSRDVEFVIAIGDNTNRARCFHRALEFGWMPATLIHPSAWISPAGKVGRGSTVLARAVVNGGAVVGENCIINTGAIVEHDCRIADHAHISPSATLGGGVTISGFAHVGLGASILPAASIGERSIVGAGAVVLKSVPEGAKAVGVPSRILNSTESGLPSKPPTEIKRILLSVPHMGGQEQQFVNQAFASNWLSTVGPNITEFEREFGERLGTQAVAVASGTAAIHLGLRALGVAPGDTVFCSDLTFVASVNPIRYQGAEPVFIDSDKETWNMDPRVLAEALRCAAARNRLPKAVVVVHLFGQCADMDPILAVCAEYGVPVLEDAAEALGATYKGRPAGTLGDVAAFSFNGNKIITTSGGGMLVSNLPPVTEKARFWATQARDAGLAYHHSELGYNYRMSNVLAGIGRGQLRVLDARVRERRAIAHRYAQELATVSGIHLMPQAAYGLHTNWLSCFLIDEERFGCSRDRLIADLDAANIETRPVWKPMHLQPLYEGAQSYGGAVSEDLFERGICLPSSSSLTAADQTYVIEQIREASISRSLLRLEQHVRHEKTAEPRHSLALTN